MAHGLPDFGVSGLLSVRGEDQLFSIDTPGQLTRSSVATGAAYDEIRGSQVPEGQIWVFCNIAGHNLTAAPARIEIGEGSGALPRWYAGKMAPLQFELVSWTGFLPRGPWAQPTVRFYGCGAGDVIRAYFLWFVMTIET